LGCWYPTNMVIMMASASNSAFLISRGGLKSKSSCLAGKRFRGLLAILPLRYVSIYQGNELCVVGRLKYPP
ncbi:MAG: hypothetical protein ACK5GD_04165, partial [Planctomycetota bacterium]